MNYSGSYFCRIVVQRTLIFVITVCFSCLICQSGIGQERGDRGDRTRSERRRSDDTASRVARFLERLDRNRNEILEPDEMVGQASNYLKSQGFDTSKPISLSKIRRKFRDTQTKAANATASSNKVIRKVPGFGIEKEPANVAGFDGTSSAATDAVSMESKYGKRVMELVNRTLQGYDRNKNDALDPQEIKTARWGNPPAQTSDTNRDGTLSKIELAERYLARDRDANRSRTSSSRDQNARSASRAREEAVRASAAARIRASQSRTTVTSPSRGRPAPTRSTLRVARPSSTPAYNSGSDRYAKYAKGLMTQYDQNKDGRLDKGEIGKMRRPPDADMNGDGFITSEELTSFVSGASTSVNKTAQTETSPEALKQTRDENADRPRRSRDSYSSSSRSRSSFSGLDTNFDGQVQMHEFSKEWDGDVLAEFQAKDANGDGVITSAEWNGGRP